MKRTMALFVGSMMLMFTLVACSSSNEEVDMAGEEVEPLAEPNLPEKDSAEIEEPEPYGFFPLTGVEIEEGTDIDYRAFGVMVENSLSARPQSGLYQADVVYEVLAEGTITRLLAFYHSQKADRIGPVRSARDYNVYLNKGYDAIYVSAGGSPAAFSLVNSGYVDYINGLTYDGRFLHRSSDRVAPHNLYTSYEDLAAAVEAIGFEFERAVPDALIFKNQLDEIEGKSAIHFEVKYGSTNNNVQFEYDEELKKYRRSNGGIPTEDLETGELVTPKNVFIVEAPHQVIPGDNAGRRDIDIEAGGRAYLIQEGMLQEVMWQNVDGIILPFRNDKQLPFLPGQTWINLVPSGNGGLDSYVEIFN
ncbi:DUF3048 domain-containing protein [Evansella sp. AB-rgal1]|uniref:DUF3048 domain-containing protein n=1 Tax=Evansella sp. AB-rgal1 TaxID=3242696 RepID=UPI00359DF6FD